MITTFVVNDRVENVETNDKIVVVVVAGVDFESTVWTFSNVIGGFDDDDVVVVVVVVVVFNKQSRFAWLRTSHGSVDKKGFPQLGHELFVCIVRETKKKKQ